jgi:hypothetical protein
MSTRLTVALALALSLGAAAPAFADYNFDASGAPTNMHLVPPPDAYGDIHASTVMPGQRAGGMFAPTVRPFTADEKRLFDRETYPTDSY